ncbi:ferrochelatase [Protaetiibacter larvae]|uniref:Coproporphyrin III ferrochelatase n=1 Tax=Protaetiibacter larvae TaxID=2592654 RepID=A0A5C1Y832_9MICO|nr:ferrochelatase [Protaetiibacter larvae]QEO09097.1 ferrochelatase [Protaetiibacter larvae]
MTEERLGPEHVETPVAYDAIVLASFGGPEGQDDVIPFLRNVTRGRGIPDERLEEVAHHYRHYGGVSPINQQNRELKAALEAELAARGIELPVYWGNRNWGPYLADTVREAYDDGHRTLIGVATSAYASYSSCRQYTEDFVNALEVTGLAGEVRLDKVRPYFDHPGFVTPFVEGLQAALTELRGRGIPGERIRVLFSTHSIPLTAATASGPEFGPGGAYEAQHLAVAEVIMREADAGGVGWRLVYQSRSGPASQPWLEPDINDVIETLPAEGVEAIVIVPLGFVSDHMEVLWDLDNEALESAAEAGLAALRIPTPGIHPAFVAGLVDLVLERVNGTPVAERPALTELGPWFDVCRPGCCVGVQRAAEPSVAGRTT